MWIGIVSCEGWQVEARRGRAWWFGVAWMALAVLCLWVTIASAVDHGGSWIVPLVFAACTLVAAACARVWFLVARGERRPDK
jgi:hypothetical protein